VDPRWNDVRSDPRFDTLVARVQRARGTPDLLVREPG
jgi:hypothetical protein